MTLTEWQHFFSLSSPPDVQMIGKFSLIDAALGHLIELILSKPTDLSPFPLTTCEQTIVLLI